MRIENGWMLDREVKRELPEEWKGIVPTEVFVKEAEKLHSIINRKLAELLRKNRYRIDFQERLEKIIDDYNMGSINIEQYFQRLTKLINDLQEEEKRHIKEGLTEEEIAVFDILIKPKSKLTKKKEQQIKTIAKELLEKLKEQKSVLDWKKKQEPEQTYNLQ